MKRNRLPTEPGFAVTVAAQQQGGSESRLERAIETAAVIMLAISSLAAAWSGYQATLWSGEQNAQYALGTTLRVEASELRQTALQKQQIDVAVFIAWLDASSSGNTAGAAFYEARFSSRLAPAFVVWQSLPPGQTEVDASSPFTLPAYVVPEQTQASETEDRAAQALRAAQAANRSSDDFVGVTVILAAVLFFCGFNPRVRSVTGRLCLIGVAACMLAIGLYQAVTLPTLEARFALFGQ